MKNESILGYALLGLVHQEPMSGYDLRKIFTTTALGSFSDSPGAIYPALRRLEVQAFVEGTLAETSGLRKRQVYSITPKGLASFTAWLRKPIERDDVVRRVEELMLRFAFMDQTLGAGAAASFLEEFAEELSGYVTNLHEYLESHASGMPLSGRLALECGIQEYETRLRWAKTSAAIYAERKRTLV